MSLCGLASLLSRPERLALLMPTDAAVADWLAEEGRSWDAVCADRAGLHRLLLGHLVSAPDGRLPQGRQQTWAPSWIEISHARMRDATGRAARVHASSTRGGGAIHLIDRVLAVPQQSLLESLHGSPDLAEFAALWQLAGLDCLLHSAGPNTLLAPINGALAPLSELRAQPERLRSALLRHLLPGRQLTAQLAAHLEPLAGSDLLLRNGAMHRLSQPLG